MANGYQGEGLTVTEVDAMIKTVTDKLLASVMGIEDLERTYPGVRSFQGRIALDIRIEQGTLSIGRHVRLSGPQMGEAVEIVGIEMHPNLEDPSLVRIFCSKPQRLVIPIGVVEGWQITEQ